MMDRYGAMWLCVSFDFVLNEKKKEMKETFYSLNITDENHGDYEIDYSLY
jgi:hypothetical protein